MSDDAKRQIQLMLDAATLGPKAVRCILEMTGEQRVKFMIDVYQRLLADELRKLRQWLADKGLHADKESAAFVNISDCRLADLDGRGQRTRRTRPRRR